MKKYLWVFVAVTVVGVAVLAALSVRGLLNLGADSGSVADVRPKSDTRSDRECVGTRPVESLPSADDDSPLMRVVFRVDKVSQAKRYAAVHTGLSLDQDRQVVDVWRVPDAASSTAFDDEVCGSAVKGVTVRLHGADIDRMALDALSDRIADDMKRWDGTFQMRQVGPDERGFVRVGVDDPDTARPIVEKAYGEENSRYIKVEYVGQSSALAG
jgi:hypothetical protein